MTQSIWFIVGSQHLYGEEALRQVADNTATVVGGLNTAGNFPLPITNKGVVTTADEITAVCRAASADEECLGVITWMHTFSPAKMWIAGLKALHKPLLHLHTQFGAHIPWATIDMDFMNLHQSAHGDREFGHICSRLGIARKVVVGHWESERVHQEIDIWQRAALGLHALRTIKVARFGDNMRSVAVTDGDKVAAQSDLGIIVDGYGIGDLVDEMATIDEAAIDACCADIDATCDVAPELQPGGERRAALRHQAHIECALKQFLTRGGYSIYDTFEDLHGPTNSPAWPPSD